MNTNQNTLNITNTWTEFKHSFNNPIISNIREHYTQLHNHLNSFNKLVMTQTNNIKEVLDDIKNTNIKSVSFVNDTPDIYGYKMLNIPSNIVELKLPDSMVSEMVFEDESNIEKIVFNKVDVENPVKLPNNIKHISLQCCKVNFVDCTFDNLQHLVINEMEEDDSFEWMNNASRKATHHVKLGPHIGYVDKISNAKSVSLTNERFLNSLNNDVESLKLYYSGKDINRIMNLINSYKSLKHLELMCDDSNEYTLSIESNNLETISLCFDPTGYDDDNYSSTCMQKIHILSDKLTSIYAFNCDILTMKSKLVTKCNLNHSNIKCDNEFNPDTLCLNESHVYRENRE